MSAEELDSNEGTHREAGSENWFTVMHRNGPRKGPFEQNGWLGYQRGFGSTANNGNFWWGLENLHKYTSSGKWNVLFKLRSQKGGSAVIKFHGFKVASKYENYRVSIGKSYEFFGEQKMKDYIGKIQGINGNMFTTKDADNDSWSWTNLATAWGGGFWFNHNFLYPPTCRHFADALMAIARA